MALSKNFAYETREFLHLSQWVFSMLNRNIETNHIIYKLFEFSITFNSSGIPCSTVPKNVRDTDKSASRGHWTNQSIVQQLTREGNIRHRDRKADPTGDIQRTIWSFIIFHFPDTNQSVITYFLSYRDESPPKSKFSHEKSIFPSTIFSSKSPFIFFSNFKTDRIIK